ncbi:predicted protein [Chaetomium globosum CBS 148.51]|uniref:Invertebrate defensins family profile domain-containing protein n=1 Tax=Chaetomium globosum (strain ATCC 6205 / CBS 148.51 / DSM 1962 / NBRC 6347 / NRRL 1970) TaxID=306901 RepID=Q2GWM6_CHAGB|nr:uncharacterized protein CHGG_07628 [Chaetomium globosum CBS 148.51]EAQ86375.1 predicted protein [Chaetomium globosum CBS 148.51]
MRFILSTLAAGLLATAPLALAQDCSSVVCVLGDGACNRVCEMEGHTEGGKCVPRDGCPAGSEICVCGAKKAKRAVVAADGDELLARALDGVATVDQFVDAVFEKRDGSEAAVDKRSVCCSFPDPVGGLCCEAHCQQIGHLEGGQCTAQNVCVCG